MPPVKKQQFKAEVGTGWLKSGSREDVKASGTSILKKCEKTQKSTRQKQKCRKSSKAQTRLLNHGFTTSKTEPSVLKGVSYNGEVPLPLQSKELNKVWSTFHQTDARKNGKCVYCVAHWVDRTAYTKLFHNVKFHTETNLINCMTDLYRERNSESQLLTLNIYLNYAPCDKHDQHCADSLRGLSREYNFRLNIRVVGPFKENRKALCNLMKAKNVTVESFNEQAWRELANLINFPLQDNWQYPTAWQIRDSKTTKILKEITADQPSV